MAIRTTVDIPEPLHEILREQARRSGSSIRALVIRALEQTYASRRKGKYVTGPLVHIKGSPGPSFPTDENPYDLVLP
jgi:hypothetical protein